MKLEELYRKPIARAVNPAVSATKFDPETERIEIEEYVFTDEIINGLFRILDAIKNNKSYDHVGIWIDGYYGSGKSHFLKYLDYCITPSTRDAALPRLLEAVKSIDPLDDKHNIGFEYNQLLDIANWLKRATIDTCIFNLETSFDNSSDRKKAFLHVFWNEFNGKRGFNKFNITLAQNLEKPLAEKGLFEQFKQRIADEGGDWNDPSMAADIIDNELGMVLDIACELAPSLDKESIRERIIRRDTNMSIDRFGLELASYLKDKGDDYRLIFLADEVSQFINKERDRYLNLQEIITKLSEACQNKVWVACTAQQDLSEIMDDCSISEEKDKEGKIKGRFEVKVSLKGTQPEVITQKRILNKKDEVKDSLSQLYQANKSAFGLQFKLPASYTSYDTQDDFIDYYPFVPYQFHLIMQVFNSFLNLGYVAKEVKGNERSIIKVVHSTAKAESQAPLGTFISFDELYNSMFEEGLQARGQKAVENAIRMASTYTGDTRLAVRVANVLFMICNISQTDQLQFPATLDNVTTLLVNDITTPRLNIKNDVEKVITFLCDNNIIRREQGRQGAPDTYLFYSEEEMKVAQLIKSQNVDNNTRAEQLREIFFKYLTTLRNKEQYMTRSFSVGASIYQRSFLSNNGDIHIDFAMDSDYDTPEQLAIQSLPTRMVYYIGPAFQANPRLKNAFHWFCQVTRYLATPAPNEENAQTRKEFSKRAQEQYDLTIIPEFHKILDSCPIISGLSVIDDTELGNKRGADRYHLAVLKHLSTIYTKAPLVNQPSIPTSSELLRKAILRPVQPGDYEGMGSALTEAEHEVDLYLNKQSMEVNVADVLSKFSKAPFGWNDICTLYIINELVRRHTRDYSFSNNPHVETSQVAAHIIAESSKFTLRPAQVISQELIGSFTQAWKDIFGMTSITPSTDSTQLFRQCRDDYDRGLVKYKESYRLIESEFSRYPFITPLRDAIRLFDSWLMERDPQQFFAAVIEKRAEAHSLIDTCKEVIQFTHDQMDNYRTILSFVRDNHDNFQFVPSELQDQVDTIRNIESLGWPIPMREYMKLRNTLSGALEQVKQELRTRITKAYSDTFDFLVKSAREQGVSPSVLSDRDATIHIKTSPDNILALQNNMDTDPFYAEQARRILAALPKKPLTPPDHPGEKGEDPPSHPKDPITMALSTRTSTPISSETEVDAYLEKLKSQLMAHIAHGDSVIIIR